MVNGRGSYEQQLLQAKVREDVPLPQYHFSGIFYSNRKRK